ncbi:MAG TPA: CADD family putative folate metabolism protein [Pseudomonadota bacterium]|jgi:pyrroloquinoline-quinone synthase|nr:CADD family putative folate metabolism protein [Pseudomonadota bacterium]HNF96029.1 CADD family putative folate metabolism protein [Pseudomonadota bacterium]HNI60667.1 CADD family putative folate metabolism protein [Pseudomonadota bacterium]HNK45734.1 CADD family putative folate metabolism protein [Pseudomonadota bacterium]HNN50181.1 CADD family putative folate metabolism protein [Pseudomonadota bacterium]
MNETVTTRFDLLRDVEFVRALDSAVQRHAMLKHPFYQAWSEGALSLDDLREYSKQYFSQVKAFPRYVSAVHSNCDDIALRQELLQNLIEEEQGEGNHPELWLRFAESLGVDRRDVESAEPTRATQASVEIFRDLTKNGSYLQGLAALYAYESQIPDVAKTKREGLGEFYGIRDPRAVSFFSVHEEADVVHRQVEVDALLSHAKTVEQRVEVLSAAEQASHALWQFLDGMQSLRGASCAC